MQKATKRISVAAVVVAAVLTGCGDKEAQDNPAPVVEATETSVVATDTATVVPDTAADTANVATGTADVVQDTATTFTDRRDGRTYRKVTLGTQTWMAENLNYAAEGSQCHENCQEYGRFYDFDTALEACPAGWHLPSGDEWVVLMNFVRSNKKDVRYVKEQRTSPATGDFEAGEYEAKFYANAGKYLKSKSGWEDGSNGTDEFGFSALPGGFCCFGRYRLINQSTSLEGRVVEDCNFDDVGYYGHWRSSTAWDDSYFAYKQGMYNVYQNPTWNCWDGNKSLLSVRCVKD